MRIPLYKQGAKRIADESHRGWRAVYVNEQVDLPGELRAAGSIVALSASLDWREYMASRSGQPRETATTSDQDDVSSKGDGDPEWWCSLNQTKATTGRKGKKEATSG